MINKKMIIVITIFVVTGFLVFSFAATPQGESVDENNNPTTTNTNNNGNKNGTSGSTGSNSKDKEKDNDVVSTPIESLDNQNNGQNIILDNNTNSGYISGDNQWASGNTGSDNTGNSGNTGNDNNGNNDDNNTGDSGNTGDNKPSEPEKPVEPGKPSEPETPTEPSEPEKPTEPDINIDELTGSSVFVSDNNSNLKPSINDNVVTYTGTIDASDVDDFGIYMTNIVVRAPYAYSQKVLKNATITTPYGEKYGSEVLQYDAEGYAYFEFSQGFFSDNSVVVNVTVNWGVGGDIVYTLKSNINVAD